MRKRQMFVSALCTLLLLSGCSMLKDDAEDVKKGADEVGDNVKEGVDKAEEKAETTISDFKNYLDENKIAYSDMKEVEAVDFAAKEGAMFTYEDQPIYLYRLNEDDETMQALLKEAKEKEKVTVNIEGEKKEMQASVNGAYLMLYEDQETVYDLRNAFSKFNMPSNARLQNQT